MLNTSDDSFKNDSTVLPKLDFISDFQRNPAWKCFIRFVGHNDDSSTSDLEKLHYVKGVHRFFISFSSMQEG